MVRHSKGSKTPMYSTIGKIRMLRCTDIGKHVNMQNREHKQIAGESMATNRTLQCGYVAGNHLLSATIDMLRAR